MQHYTIAINFGSMSIKKILLAVVVILLIGAAIKDAIHFSEAPSPNKISLKEQGSLSLSVNDTILMVYNAYNGIYPAAIDYVKKNVFPSTYPCHLCYLAFGNNGPLPAWQFFLDSLPYIKQELHKEDFKKKYLPANTALPVILYTGNKQTSILVNAGEINACTNLDSLINLTKFKINKATAL